MAELLFALFKAGAEVAGKRYEPPRTAYQRLCAPGMLTPKQTRPLRERYESLDPFDLKDELEKKLRRILLPKPG